MIKYAILIFIVIIISNCNFNERPIWYSKTFEGELTKDNHINIGENNFSKINRLDYCGNWDFKVQYEINTSKSFSVDLSLNDNTGRLAEFKDIKKIENNDSSFKTESKWYQYGESLYIKIQINDYSGEDFSLKYKIIGVVR